MTSVLKELNKLLKAIASILAHVATVLTKDGLLPVARFFYNQVLAFLQGIEEIAADAAPLLMPIAQTFVKYIAQYGPPIQDFLKREFSAIAQAEFTLVDNNLRANGRSTPDNSVKMAGDALGEAFGFGLASAGVTAAFEAATPEKLNVLNGLGPMFAQMAGFAEISGAVRGTLYRAAFGQSLEYHYNQQFRPRILDVASARAAFRRRLISQAQFEQILAYNGLSPDWVSAEEAVAFNPIPARLMLAAIDDTSIDPNLIKPFLRDNGYPEAQLDSIIGSLFFKATKTIRHEALLATMANYEIGIHDDAALIDAMTNAQISHGVQPFYLAAAKEKRLKVLTEDYKKGWDAKFLAGEITANDYRVALSGLGYTAPVIDAIVGMQSAKLDAHEFAGEQAVERQQRRKDQEVAIQSALAGFKEHKLDVVALTAALIAAQLPAETVALYVALAEARGQVAMKTPRVTRTASQTLAIKAAAEEYLKGTISTAQFEQQLKNAGMSAADILNEVAYMQARGAKGVLLDPPQPTP